MDRREHHRAQLRLPVRLRWSTPFGHKTEVCETVDASRGGLLVPCLETHAAGVPLWVTFPYDRSLGYGQPEMLAKVVRTMVGSNGVPVANTKKDSPGIPSRETNGAHAPMVAVHFEMRVHPQTNGNKKLRQPERRSSPRQRLAMPIRVRPGNVPWFEEAMTADISSEGLRFLSSREYRHGENLFVSFEPTALAPWAG